MGYVCEIPKPEGGYSACSQILCNDSTSCDEVDGYYVTQADTMINIYQSILFKCNSYTIIFCLWNMCETRFIDNIYNKILCAL